jgi:gluconate 2-dehydrogenase gamma chain
MVEISRRTVLKAAGLVGVAVLPQSRLAAVPTPADTQPITYLFLNSEEAAFGVPSYIDKQLAGAWGSGERLYRSGPWRPGTPSQGYPLPFTPAELFRTSLAAINNELAHAGTPFARMSSDQQDAYLAHLEKGGKDLGRGAVQRFLRASFGVHPRGFLQQQMRLTAHELTSAEMHAVAVYYGAADGHE